VGPSTGLFDLGGQQLVTPPIRGRAGELKVIGALVTALGQGRGGVLVIEGPPGIGKSRLLTEVLALADKAGVRTLFGEAFEYQQTVPFFSLFMATLRADPPVGDADALRRLGGSADLRYWVVHDLADAIHAAAAETPLAIVLEDIHWADNGTLLALRSLATARPDVAVLWVLTARTGAGGPAVQDTLSVLHRADATVVRLAAMSASAVADMVQDAVRANADESLLNLAAKAHGNPFLVGELVGGGRGGPARRQRWACGGHRTRAAATSGRGYAAAPGPAFRGCWRGGAGGRGAAGPVLGGSVGRDAGTPAGVVDGGCAGGGVRGSARRRG
jgi:AAA ATPase domain